MRIFDVIDVLAFFDFMIVFGIGLKHPFKMIELRFVIRVYYPLFSA